MAKHQSIDNGDTGAKLLVRQRALELAGPEPMVLDCYAGEGHMHDAVWAQASRYLGIEKRFSRSRGNPHGECWRGDNQVLLSRALEIAPWNVVDLDAYGNPWPMARLLLKRAPGPRLIVTATDGTERGLAGGVNGHEFAALVAGAARLSYSSLLIRWRDDLMRWTLAWVVGGRWKIASAQFIDSETTKVRYWLLEFVKTPAVAPVDA